MSFPYGRAALATTLVSTSLAFVACGGSSTPGFGPGGKPPASTATGVKPAADVPASKSMNTQYGITHWRMFLGKDHTIVTGYRADGSAARGFDFGWFTQASDGTPGHVRVAMLDGSGTAVRRYVGGRATGVLSPAQQQLVTTAVVDLYEYSLSRATPPPAHKRGRGGLHQIADGISGGTVGPKCLAAKGSNTMNGVACAISMPADGALVGIIGSAVTCGSWIGGEMNANQVCDDENAQYCTTAADGTQQCDYSGQSSSSSSSSSGGSTTPGDSLTQQDLCANYPNSSSCKSLIKTDGFCSQSSDCVPGDECQSGYCTSAGYTGIPGDECKGSNASTDPTCNPSTTPGPNTPPTDSGIQGASSNSTCMSCPPGTTDVTADPQTGAVSPSGSGDGTGGSSTSSSSSGTDPGQGGAPTDPGGGLGNAPACQGEGGDCSGGQTCCGGTSCDASSNVCTAPTGTSPSGSCQSYYGGSCSTDADCCLGSCNGSTCEDPGSNGNGNGGSSSGSSSGGTCSSDGTTCSTDGECCSGTCDTSTGTCGSGSSSSSSSGGSSGSSSGGTCSADGASCSTDGECCSGTCDTSTGTCGSGSSSSSSGGSSSSSSGGSCSADGSSCSSAGDCCSGSCGSCDGTCGGKSAGAAGASCSTDADCCNTCDTGSGTCQ